MWAQWIVYMWKESYMYCDADFVVCIIFFKATYIKVYILSVHSTQTKNVTEFRHIL